MSDIYKQVENETHILKIVRDIDSISPREEDNLGTMTCFHRRHSLGDKHNYSDKDEMILDLLTDTLGDSERAERMIDRVADSIDKEVYHVRGRDFYRAIDEKLFETIEEKFVILPLYLHDHSGITISTSSFSCPWDSGQVGWIYVSLEKIRKKYGIKKVTKKYREKVIGSLINEVEIYDQYLTCDTYGFILEKKTDEGQTEQIDSCYGFYGTDFKQNGIMDHISEEHKELVNSL